MQTRNTLQTPTSLTPGALRLGPDHGYAFDGDQVQLNAELLGNAAGNWALQLWACDAPFDGRLADAPRPARSPVREQRRVGR